jgi:spore germination protein GerM
MAKRAEVDNKRYFIVGISFLAALIAGLFIYSIVKKDPIINDFTSCAASSGVVMESYPRQCRAPDGTIYTEDVTISDPQPTQPEPETYDVLVYFSHNPKSYEDFTYTVTAPRTSDRKDIGTYTIEQLIQGPTADEAAQSLFSPLQNKLTGDSNCGGPDFSLVINEDGLGTLRFCKDLITAGIGEDAIITETTTQTLKQFSTINKVTILTKSGDCFGDMSGENRCLL